MKTTQHILKKSFWHEDICVFFLDLGTAVGSVQAFPKYNP